MSLKTMTLGELERKPRRPNLGAERRAVALLRVSTDDQALGLDAQRTQITGWAERNGIEVIAWFADADVCGATPLEQRAGLGSALDALKTQNAGILVVAKRCRLARDTMRAMLIERLVEHAGAKVATADGIGAGDTPEAKLLRGMLDLVAEYERALIRLRTRAALAVKKARGERIGNVPHGYREVAGGKLEPDPAEQATIRLILELRAEGHSYKSITDALNTRGAPGARGKRWHQNSVVRLVKRGTAA